MLGSSLYHNSFESYAIYEHTNRGFPDDWLTQTFSNLTHSLAFISVLAGTIGQSVNSVGPLGCIASCFVLYLLTTFYIFSTWSKDNVNGSKFTFSNFSYNLSQLISATQSNRSIFLLQGISICSEASITIFTFYWAPWITNTAVAAASSSGDWTGLHSIPYEIIYSSFVSMSMLGNYIYQLFHAKINNSTGGVVGLTSSDGFFQAILILSSVSFFLGAITQTPIMIYVISLVIQLCIGCYWPCIGKETCD